jgi:hypothetical protein
MWAFHYRFLKKDSTLAPTAQVEWLAALNEQRNRIRSLHSLVVQLSGPEEAPAQLETASATAREGAYEAKYKRAKNLLQVQAQHVCQLQGGLVAT